MKNTTIEEIKCCECNQVNYINPNLVHAEDNSPFQLYCTYCKAEIESKIILLDKVTITTNTAFLLNQVFGRAETVEGDTLDGKLLKWVKRQHEKSWSNYGKDVKNKKSFVRVTMELCE